MSDTTKIEWCDSTFNPWEGCQKVGPGCDHCYAETRNARFGGGAAVNWGPGAPRRRTSAANWRKPLAWNAQHEAFFAEHGRRQRVFCASLADVFDNAVSPQWRADLFNLILSTPNLDWLLLTKRIGNAARMIDEVLPDNMKALPADHPVAWPWANVWIGATVVNQAEADRDIPKLLAVPAAKRFLSIEPLLGPVDLTSIDVMGGDGVIFPLKGTSDCVDDEGAPADDIPALDWVIVGGESGPNARPMHPDWARSLRDQCQAAGVPFLFKQWGEWVPYEDSAQPPFKWSQHGHEIDGHVLPDFESEDGQRQREWHCDWSDMLLARRVGKKAAGRLLDGVEHNGFPA